MIIEDGLKLSEMKWNCWYQAQSTKNGDCTSKKAPYFQLSTCNDGIDEKDATVNQHISSV